jgi:hypothetical protein
MDRPSNENTSDTKDLHLTTEEPKISDAIIPIFAAKSVVAVRCQNRQFVEC